MPRALGGNRLVIAFLKRVAIQIAGLGLRVIHYKDDEEELYTLRNPSPDPSEFCPLTDEQLTKEKGEVAVFEWSPDGSSIAFVKGGR